MKMTIEKVRNGYIVASVKNEEEDEYSVFNHIEHLYEWMQEYFDDQVEPMPPVTKAQEDWKKLTNKIKSEKAAEL